MLSSKLVNLLFLKQSAQQLIGCSYHSSSVRLARNAFSRKPIKVLEVKPEVTIDPLGNSYQDNDDLLDLDAEFCSPTAGNDAKKNKTFNVSLPRHEVMKSNKKFLAQVIAARNKKFRKRKGLLVLEGSRLIDDAFQAGLSLKTVYFSKEEKLLELRQLKAMEEKQVQFCKINSKDIRLFSELKTCPEVMAIFDRPDLPQLKEEDQEEEQEDRQFDSVGKQSLPLYLIADNIRDPGNLGTLIRAAVGCGVRKVICSKGCVDIWESKVIRASAGSIFRFPIVIDQSWIDIENYLSQKHEFFGAYLADVSNCDKNQQQSVSEVVPYTSVKYFNALHSACVLIVSGEVGNSEEAKKLIEKVKGQRVNIEMNNQMESLNNSIAGCILLYEIRRQFQESN